MSRTPALPPWIRSFRHEGYTNVFELFPEATALYGTETLFGDWDAEVLLLAKDGAPTHVIREKGWRHAQRALGDTGGWGTNEKLVRLATHLPGTKRLYGSAAANMLFDDPQWSRNLTGIFNGPLHDYLQRVLAWVVESMPNLRAIACLGNEAWYLSCTAMQKPVAARQFAEYRDSGRMIEGAVSGRSIALCALYHPAARVSAASKEANWHNLSERLRIGD